MITFFKKFYFLKQKNWFTMLVNYIVII